jgi:hypothetical protein
MKKIFILYGLTLLGILSCSKSGNDAIEPVNNTEVAKANQSQDFALNNLKLNASTVREWLSTEGMQNIVFTFFSKDLSNVNTNLILSAYAYRKNSTALPSPVLLEIASKSSLQLQSNITLPNNQVTIDKIRKIVSDESGIIDFDYILFEPKYYTTQSNVYISYTMTPYKNGAPVINANSMQASGEDITNPSPPKIS